MSYNSLEFWAFFGAVFGLHWLIPASLGRVRNLLLLAASYVFYGFWGWPLLLPLFFSTVVDYFCALRIRGASGGARRAFLWTSIAVHVATLAAFKHAGFLALGTGLVSTIGLSFYTFQAMGYVIDVYRGREAEEDFLHFALFVSFFPVLLAGPIERAGNLLPQIAKPRAFQSGRFYAGMYLIVWGLFQKIVVADNLEPWVRFAFDETPWRSFGLTLLGAYAFAFQLYADFSGYSDIARGVGLCLGFELSVNFFMPYLASNIADFWKRWHMTLTRWWIDYLYTPLFWNSYLPWKMYAAPFLTMFMTGVWHGLGSNHLLMGAYFGLLSAGYIGWVRRREALGAALDSPLARGLSILATFHAVCVGQVMFRSGSAAEAFAYLRGFASPLPLEAELPRMAGVLALVAGPVLAMQVLQWARNDAFPILRMNVWTRAAVCAAILYGIFAFSGDHNKDFIYFDF